MESESGSMLGSASCFSRAGLKRVLGAYPSVCAWQTGFGMGNLGALQRSVSALHLQQYQQQQVQQQQQQLLLQQLNLANMNPQALAQVLPPLAMFLTQQGRKC